MSAVRAQQTNTGSAGYWRIIASNNGKSVTDITYVRAAVTGLDGWTLEDPYGPKQFTLSFPAITVFDRLGSGELDFIRKDTNVDIKWIGDIPTGYPDAGFAVEGYMESFDYGSEGLKVTCKGAAYQLDNYQAKPEYLAQPLPYEAAIARQWVGRPDLRLRKLSVEWPTDWPTIYRRTVGVASYLVPTNITDGDRWTGLVTRDSGKWEPVLTSYIQTLLSSMYTDKGRWTIDIAPGRRPILRHRDFLTDVKAGCLFIDPATPGFEHSLNVDYSQSLNVLYGQGQSLTGVGYSGQLATEDGARTTYQPLAALRQVYPAEKNETWLDPDVMRRETLLQLQAGLEANQAAQVGADHLAHFSEPGVTGTITLTCDPLFLGSPDVVMNRMIIKPGMSIQVPRLFGNPEGLLFHISAVEANFAKSSVTLTLDTKYRDALTLAEVKLRGRDSLAVQRSLIGGQYNPPIPDQLVPWNYAEGSGFIPSGVHESSVPLFSGMPASINFPWTEWITQRPPSDPSYRHCYIHIGPKSANANNNWGTAINRDGGVGAAIPIRVSQAGTIRLIEVAAYDKNGNVFQVPFHISFWYARGVSYTSTPYVRDVDVPTADGYQAGQYYPFFQSAWESFNIDGSQIINPQQTTAKSGGRLIKAYGTGLVKAGYWPGSSWLGDQPTGLLSDETPLQYNLSDNFDALDPYHRDQGATREASIYCLIYCDGQLDQDVYFVGRMYRQEPGSTT